MTHDFLVPQLCHDLDNYCRYMECVRKAGVTLHVVFGLMPVLVCKSTMNMAFLNGCSIPRELTEIIGKYGDKPDNFKKHGKEYTVKQIERIVKEDIAGLHIFALNNTTMLRLFIMHPYLKLCIKIYLLRFVCL